MPDDFAKGRAEAGASVPAQVGFALLGRALGETTARNLPPEAAFLRDAAARIGPLDASVNAMVHALAHPDGAPLFRLGHALGFTVSDLVAVGVCLSVEQEAIAGRAVAYMQAPVGGARPTAGLLATVLASLPGGEGGVPALVSGAAVRAGVLCVAEAGPLPERSLRIPEGLVAVLSGGGPVWPGLRQSPVLPDPIWPESLAADVANLAQGLTAPEPPVVVIRRTARADRVEIAARLADALGRRAAFFDLSSVTTEGLGAFVVAGGMLPFFETEIAPGDVATLPSLEGSQGPIVVFAGPDGTVAHRGRSVIGWELPLPDPTERTRLWEQTFGPDGIGADLGREHLQSAGRIRDICRAAEAEARLRGRDRPARDDLRAAIWVADGGGLGALAQPIRDAIPEDAMIMGPALRRDLGYLLARCRAREKLTEGLGGALRARYRVGVRSLFVGPSGTGKTLAAAWLSERLTLPLYRVDLAAVSSKYIGETEKNLSQLLARAEEQEIVLLFDEADSLFGKRTDISDSNDRFANAQTNYLLQRIETYSGIVVLTSNARNRFDEAFTRRIDAIVDFLQPEAEERMALWRAHLGGGHALRPAELNRLAAFADITGGHIRNVVLMAAVLARDSAEPIGCDHVLDGLVAEYRKLGLTVPSELMILRSGT